MDATVERVGERRERVTNQEFNQKRCKLHETIFPSLDAAVTNFAPKGAGGRLKEFISRRGADTGAQRAPPPGPTPQRAGASAGRL